MNKSNTSNSISLLVYQALIERNDLGKAMVAAYYSLEDGKYRFLYEQKDAKKQELCRIELDRMLERILSEVQRGDFAATPETRHASNVLPGTVPKEVLDAMITFEQFLERVSLYPDEDQMRAINADELRGERRSGKRKTMVLSYRFVRLVLERKLRFDQILTLTFTRKAAREMHERIHDHLFLCNDDEEIRSSIPFPAPLSARSTPSAPKS